MKTKLFCIGDLKLDTDYIYNRPNGGTTYCYGKIRIDSNFIIECDDEGFSGVAGDIDGAELNTWKKVCDHLYNNYRRDVEQITLC